MAMHAPVLLDEAAVNTVWNQLFNPNREATMCARPKGQRRPSPPPIPDPNKVGSLDIYDQNPIVRFECMCGHGL